MKQKHKLLLSRKDKEKRRLKAAKMFEKGQSQAAVARKFNITTAAINQWHEAWKRGGAKALKSKGHPGFPSELTETDRRRLKKIILAGPGRYGYQTELWTLSRMAAVIKKEFRITFTEVWVWKIVISLGFTCQKPQLKSKERNEKAIIKWKTETFPGLKKMGAKKWLFTGV